MEREPMTPEHRAQVEALARDLVQRDADEEEIAMLAVIVVAAARGEADAMKWLRTRRGIVPATADRVVQAARALAWLQ